MELYFVELVLDLFVGLSQGTATQCPSTALKTGNILMFRDYSNNPKYANLFERNEQSNKPSPTVEEWEGAKPEMQEVADKLFNAFQNGR